MRTKLIVSIAAGLLLGGLGAFAIFGSSSNTSGTATQSGTALIGGPFQLSDTSGKPVTDEDFRGRYMLLFFGFTNCPDICPAGLQLIGAALDKLGDKADKVVPIFVSVDPERDTLQKLAIYVKNFDDRVVGLTGTPEQINAIAKAYRVFFEKTPNEAAPQEYGINHTSIIYLMGPDGKYVDHFTPMTGIDAMVEKLDKRVQ